MRINFLQDFSWCVCVIFMVHDWVFLLEYQLMTLEHIYSCFTSIIFSEFYDGIWSKWGEQYGSKLQPHISPFLFALFLCTLCFFVWILHLFLEVLQNFWTFSTINSVWLDIYFCRTAECNRIPQVLMYLSNLRNNLN